MESRRIGGLTCGAAAVGFAELVQSLDRQELQTAVPNCSSSRYGHTSPIPTHHPLQPCHRAGRVAWTQGVVWDQNKPNASSRCSTMGGAKTPMTTHGLLAHP